MYGTLNVVYYDPLSIVYYVQYFKCIILCFIGQFNYIFELNLGMIKYTKSSIISFFNEILQFFYIKKERNMTVLIERTLPH